MEKVPDGFVEMENKRTGGGCDGAGEMPTPGLLSKIPLVDPASWLTPWVEPLLDWLRESTYDRFGEGEEHGEGEEENARAEKSITECPPGVVSGQLIDRIRSVFVWFARFGVFHKFTI